MTRETSRQDPERWSGLTQNKLYHEERALEIDGNGHSFHYILIGITG